MQLAGINFNFFNKRILHSASTATPMLAHFPSQMLEHRFS